MNLAHHGDPYRPGDPPPTADKFKDGAICREENATTGQLVREFYCNGTPTTTTLPEATTAGVASAYVVTPTPDTVLVVPTTEQPQITPSASIPEMQELPRTGSDFVEPLGAVAGVLLVVGIPLVVWAKALEVRKQRRATKRLAESARAWQADDDQA